MMVGQQVMAHLERFPVRLSTTREKRPESVRLNACNTRMETIGQRVRRLREAKKLSRDKLARMAGMPKSSLQYLEDSDSAKASRYMRSLSDALGVNFLWLETGQGEQFTHTGANGDEGHPVKAHLLRLDPDMVRKANRMLSGSLASFNLDDLAFDLDRDAELFVLAYQWNCDQSRDDVLDEILAGVKKLANKGATHGRSDQAVKQARKRKAG